MVQPPVRHRGTAPRNTTPTNVAVRTNRLVAQNLLHAIEESGRSAEDVADASGMRRMMLRRNLRRPDRLPLNVVDVVMVALVLDRRIEDLWPGLERHLRRF